MLALAACHSEPAPQKPKADGQELLRAVYRDATTTMVVAVPEAGTPRAAAGNCAEPLLIDTATRQARVLSAAEVQERLRTMQLAGATRGACLGIAP